MEDYGISGHKDGGVVSPEVIRQQRALPTLISTEITPVSDEPSDMHNGQQISAEESHRRWACQFTSQ